MALQLYGGNEGGARVYMGTPNREFLGETPLQMLLTNDAGEHQVEDLLFAQLRGDCWGYPLLHPKKSRLSHHGLLDGV
jgi:hypothetical protein